MSEEDKKYLRLQKNRRPSDEVFIRLVQILDNLQKQTDQLLKTSSFKTA